jgi:hypothetical protein
VPPGTTGAPLEGARPLYDIVLPPTVTTVQSAGSLLDVAPSGGADVVVVGLIAAVIAGVLVLIVRWRSRR